MLQILGMIAGLGSLVCFIMVVIQMFQHGQQTLGIVCCVLALCGIGILIAFVVGWMNASNWGIQNIMIIWSVLVVANIALSVAGGPIIQFNQFQR